MKSKPKFNAALWLDLPDQLMTDFGLCSHAIVSSSVGPEYYVTVLSFVDKTQLEPGCSVLMHNKVRPQCQQM